MIKDLIGDIREKARERLNSPLLGTFILSWLVINYKIGLVLVFSDSLDDRLELIPIYLSNYWISVLYPIFTTAFYVLIFPFPARWVYHFGLHMNKRMIQIRNQVEDSTPLTQEEARELRRLVRATEQSAEQDIERHRKRISELEAENESLRTKRGNQQEGDRPQSAGVLSEPIQVSPLHIFLLELVTAGDPMQSKDRSRIIKSSKISPLDAQVALDEMKTQQLISMTESFVSATDKGRATLSHWHSQQLKSHSEHS